MPQNVKPPSVADRPGVTPPSSPSNSGRDGKRDSRAPGCLPFRIAVAAAGIDLQGRSFVANSFTEMIAPSGCTILLKQALATDDEIDLRIGDHELHGHVAGKLKSFKDGHLYAVEIDPSAGQWDVSFPQPAEPPPTLLLHCSGCDLTGDVVLTGLDALVHEAMGSITRTCPRCRQRTRWAAARGADHQPGKASLRAPSPGAPPVVVLPLAGYIEPLPPRPRSRDERRNARVQLKSAKACVETPVRGIDIVVVVDMSKGGLRFVSTRRYECGDWMRVAVPYIPGANNIFVPAEVVRVHKGAGDGVPGEYALIFRSN